MKKTLQLLALLALLCVPWVGRAQLDVTVADGTVTNNYVPVYGLYCDDYQKAHFVYPAELLDEMTSGSQISQMVFYLQNVPNAAWTGLFNIYLTEVNDASISAFADVSTMQQVYTGTLDATSGTMTVEFVSNYTYNGGNLLIAFEEYQNGNYKAAGFYGITSTGSSVSGYNGSSLASVTSATQRNFLPKVTFSYIPGGGAFCAKPATLNVFDITSEGASFSWSGTEAGLYQFETKTAADSIWSIWAPQTDTSFGFFSLNPNTAYNARVKALCSDSLESGYKTVNFRTACAPISLPYVMGFEDGDLMGTSTSMEKFPWCWTRINDATSSTYNYYPVCNNSSSYVHTGSRYLQFTGGTSASYPEVQVAVLPPLDVTLYPMNANRITFWGRSSSASYNKVVYIGTMSDPTDFNTFVLIDSVVVSGTTYTKYAVPLANANATDAYVAIWAQKSNGTLYVDDVTLEELPSCLEVVSVAVDAASSNSITLSWLPNEANTNASYSIYIVGGDGSNTLVASGITGTSYTVMGLDANTPYTFAVQTNCPAGDAAMISVSGRTACVPLSEDMLPYVEDFEEYGTGSSQPISPCWRKGTNGTTAYPYPYSSAAINGNRGLYFYGYHPSSATSTMTYCWAALPPVDESVDISNLMVTFNAKRYSSTSATYHSTIMVGIAESVETLTSAGAIDSMVTWMGYYDLTPEAAGTIVEERVSFANYQGNGKYVVFYCPSPELGSGSYAYNYIYIDDVVLRNIPTCPDVTGLIASDVTAESVTLTWDYDADTYTLYNIADGSVLGTVTDTAYTIAGLVPTTNYTFGVAANCGSDQGQMATITFRTTGIPISLPYATGFEDGEDQGWEFVNGSNGWTIGSATSNFGTNALYISNDNGVSNSYTLNTASTSYAYRTIQIEQPGQYTVSFNWKGNGESSYDFLRAWLAPASFQFTANAYPTTSGSYNGSYSPDGWYGLGGKMNLQSEWQIFSQIIEVTEPGNYNLVFMWRNDNSGGNQPPIAVDNVSIDQITCPAPINLTATTTANEATITWQSLGYESVWYVYSESDGEVYWTSTPSFTMTGLMPMTSYSVAVAANCGDSDTSVWTSYTFTTLEDGGSDTSFIDCTGNYCNITIVGSDSYGDGWNGGSINVMQAGNVIGSFAVDNSEATATFSVCGDYPVNFIWNTGSYDGEVSFVIYDGGGAAVYTCTDASSIASNFFTLDNACPSCLPVNGLTVTSTTNSATLYWGDSTSNGLYNIYMNGEVIDTFVYGNSYTIYNLASNTEYTFGVQVVCSADDVSSLATVSVRTACDGISQQTYEDEACGIYYFDGYTFTESGIYGDTIYDEYGCMVARTLVLTIHPEYYDTIQATATNYYVWYGDTLTGDGLYPHIEYTIDGCDSIEFLMLSVNYTMDCGEGVSSVTVKNADASDAVNSYVPGYSLYNNSYSEVIIPADRLEGIGTIKALQFKPANTNGGTYFTNCEVYLANTSDDNLSAGFTADRSSFQQVWSGDMSYTSADWQTLMFTTPFVWDGTSNIVVAVIRNHGSYANGSSFEAYTADAQLARYVYNDNNQYNISAVSDGTASNTPAWYKLLGCNDGAVITCARVRDQYADATSNSVTLHWSDPTNTVATYNVYNITNTDTILVASNISDTLYVVNNLESNTPYVFGIEANCGTGDVSTMARVSVRTQCDAISTLPYTMDFEAQNLQGTTNALAFPWCWTRINNLSTGYYIDYPYVSQYSSGYNSTNALQFYYYSYGSDTVNTVMGFVLPALDIETYPMNGNRISFWAKGESWNSNTYSLQVGTMSNPADMSTFTPVETVTVDATEYTKYTVSLANANSTNAYVAVMAFSPNGTMYLDDLTLEVLPACADITGLTLVNVTENSATISWDAVADSYTVLMNGSEISVIDTTYTFTDLMPMTQYTIGVAANCGSSLGLTAEISFSTSAIPAMLPYATGFEAGEDAGWLFVNGGNAWITGSATSVNGSNALYVSNDNGVSNSYTNSQSAISYAYRTISIDAAGSYAVSFDWKSVGESNYDYMRAWLAPANFQFIANLLPNGSTSTYSYTTTTPAGWYDLGGKMNLFDSWQNNHQVVSIAEAGNYNLVFMWCNDNSSGNNPPAAVDNVSIAALSCSAPTNLVATATATEATIMWEATGNETEWLVVVNNMAYVTTSNFYTLTNLNPMTTYEVSVAAICGSSDTSFWTSTTFTTECSGGNCEVAIVGADSYGDGWNNAAINVMQNGAVVSTFTLPSGSSALTGYVSICAGMPISFNWVSGSYDSECSFEILNANGVNVYSAAGSEMSAGQFFTMENCYADASTDTTTVVDATISADEIIYWVGSGSNEAILAVNWADTALAWGYRWNGDATVSSMMTAIANDDPRFSYEYDGWSSMSNIMFNDGEVSLSTPYNDWWWINVNGSGNNGGMGQTLYDGNFVKWGLYSVGVAVDSAYYEGYGYANELAFPMTVYPVSEPDDTIYMSATACDSYTWRVGDQEYNLNESGVWYQYDYNTGRVYFLDLTINQSSETHLYDTAYGMYVDEWGYGYNYDYEYENWYTNAEGCDSIVWHHITVLPLVNEEPYVVSSCGCYWTRSNNLCESGTYNNVEYYDENDYLRVGTLVLTVNENYYLDTTVVTTDSYYVFNGDTLTQSGRYESFNTRANGCDSIIYLHLQMLTGETQYVTACDEYCTENGWYCFNESGEYVVERWNDSTYESYLLNLTINHSSYSDIYDTAYGKFVLDEYNYYNYDCEFYYTMEGANAVGCDSIVYLHVRVLPIVNEETVVVSACDYYGTRYHNYSVSGVYENVEYVDEEGNLRIGTIDLTINHSYSFDTTVVTDEGYYVWNGDTYTQSGWYSSYNTTVGGCDSTYWLHLQILSGETQTVTACDYYYDEQWNYYGESGVYVVDRWNDSTYVSYILNLTINHSQRVDTTIVFDGNPVVWNGQVYTEPGYYTYTTTGSNGCDSTQQLHLVTIQEVTIDMTGDGYLLDYTNQMRIHNDTTIVYEGEGGCYQLVTFVPSEGEYYNVAGEFCRVVSVALDGESFALDNIKVYEGMGSSGYIIYYVCIPNDGANHTLNVVYGPYYDETSCNSMYNMHVTDPFDTTAWVNWVAGVGTHTYEVSYGLYDEFNADSLTFSGNYTTVNVTSYDTNISYQLTGLQMNTHYAVIVKMFCENGGWWYYWNGFWTSGAPHSITFSNNGGAVSGELWGRDTTITYNYYEGWSYGTYLYSLSNEWADEYEVARNRRELHQVIVDGQSLNLNGDSTASYQFMPSSVEEDITGYYFRINYDADHTVQFVFGPGAGDVVYDTVMLNQTVCGSFAWELSGETYTQSGVYMYTVVSENVETTYILNLTVNNATNNLYTETACDSYTWNNTPYSVSGIYTYSYTNEAGCASVDTLQLTINQSTTGSEVVSACNSYVWHGREFFAATDTATYTTVNANGCDSTVTLHLTINQCSTTEITACDSYIWHGIPYTNSGVFTYGNDTLVLTINRSTRGIEVATACNSYEWHGNLYTESIIATDTTENVAGCDSITTLYLTVNQCSMEEVTACDSYEWNNLLLTSSGVYTLGNDTLILTINRSTRGIEVVSACNSYEWHGTVYTSSINNVTYTTTNAAGCDSVATLYLTVNQCSTTDAVACDSYEWNGSVYNASGTYIIGNDTLNLTINRSNFGDTIAQVCGSFNWYEHTGLAIDTTVAHHFANYNQAGCDSIVTLHLTVFSCSTTEATACESYRWHGNTYTSSGIYRIDHDTLILTINRASHGDTIARACGSFDWYEHLGMTTDTTVDHAFVGTGSNGCDSVVTLHLIVNDCSTTEAVACDSYVWEKNGQTYTSSGVFRDGYDTLRLTINRANHKDIFVTSCGNYDWYEYTGLNQSMTVDHTFPGANQYGCDSIVSLHLTVTQCSVEHVTACNIYLWHNMPLTSSGTYVYGSDTLHLTISRRTLGDTLAIAYGSFDWYGNHITATGTYDHTLIGANQYGCDSTISLLAIILQQPSNPLPGKDVPEIVYYTGCDTVFIPYGNTRIPVTTSRSIPSILTGDSIVVTVNHSSTGDTIAQACGSFLWYQHSLTESSTVTHTFAGANQSSCDSVVTLHLTINQCSTLDTTVCGQFTWHGQTFRSSTLWNDGNDTLRLTVNQPGTGDTTAEACGSYDWYEHVNVTQSGNLTHLFTNAAGCDSTVTLHLTINQCSKTDTTVCGSYTWNGHLYRSSGTYKDGNDTLVLNVKQKSTGDTLVTVCGSYDWYEHQNVTESGDLTHLFTNAVGCDSTVTLHLTVNSCSTTHVEACGTYLWKGSTYNASGRYIIGADTLNLTIKEQPTGDTTAAVCGGLSWYEHGFLSESTTVTHAFEKAFGCDSIVTLHLTVYQCSTTEENTCDSYEWHSNVYDQSGTFVDGYDTLRLTIRRSSVGVETATACNMYSWYGRIFTESTDTATRVVSNTVGCDSVITLHLTVNQCSSTDLTVCDSVTWHGVLYTQSGTFFDGHDTLHLTVNNSTTGVETVTACNSYDWYEHTGITASCYNLTHTFVAGNQYGCDSIVTLNLTINQCSRTEVTECDSYVWRGTTYTQSGTYTDGNDTLVLTINHSVATEQNVTANNSYTWHGQTYTQSGDYTWEGTTVAGCDSTVTLHLTINNGIDDVEEAELNVSIYPNPTHGLVNIEANGNVSKVEVYDINGRKVAIYDNTTIIDLSNMASGTYTMRIHTQLGTTIKRVILK